MWRLPHASTVLLFGLVLYAAVWLAAPVAPTLGEEGSAWGQLTLYSAALLAGTVLGRVLWPDRPRSGPAWLDPNLELDLVRLIRATFAVSGAGVALRLLDRFILRPELLFSNIDLADSGSTIAGFLSAFLYPVGIASVPLVTLAHRRGVRLRLRTVAFSYFLFFFAGLDAFLVGKRGVAVTLVAMFTVLLLTSSKRVTPRRVIALLGVLLAALMAFGWVVARRLEDYGFDMCHSLYNSKYALTLRPTGIAREACSTETFWSTPVQFLTNFAVYYLHGAHEFALSLPYVLSQDNWTWGGTTFAVFLKPACLLTGGGSSCSTETSAFRPGVYTTAWGPLLQDFGPATVVVAVVIGLAVSWVRSRARLCFGWYPLYLFLATVLFFTPVVNLIQSGLGSYLLVGGILFRLIYYATDGRRSAHRVR